MTSAFPLPPDAEARLSMLAELQKKAESGSEGRLGTTDKAPDSSGAAPRS